MALCMVTLLWVPWVLCACSVSLWSGCAVSHGGKWRDPFWVPPSFFLGVALIVRPLHMVWALGSGGHMISLFQLSFWLVQTASWFVERACIPQFVLSVFVPLGLSLFVFRTRSHSVFSVGLIFTHRAPASGGLESVESGIGFGYESFESGSHLYQICFFTCREC